MYIKLKILIISLILVCSLTAILPVGATDIDPDTWAMNDGLGRVLSDNRDVGNTKNNKTVAML